MSDILGMYNNACAFYDCAKVCRKNAEEGSCVADHLLFTPSIVNCAFACELFYKLIAKCFKVKYKKVHDLYDLFKLLPQDEQECVYNKMFSKTVVKDVYGNDLFKKSADSFNEWRYSFESDRLVGYSGFLFSLCDVLKEEASKLLSIQ